MPQLRFAPRALDDLQGINERIAVQFGQEKAATVLKRVISDIRILESFPLAGLRLEDLIDYPTDYRYLVVRQNYVFYRIERDETIRVIRILNEKQDFLEILFGISSISGEGERFWDGLE